MYFNILQDRHKFSTPTPRCPRAGRERYTALLSKINYGHVEYFNLLKKVIKKTFLGKNMLIAMLGINRILILPDIRPFR